VVDLGNRSQVNIWTWNKIGWQNKVINGIVYTHGHITLFIETAFTSALTLHVKTLDYSSSFRMGRALYTRVTSLFQSKILYTHVNACIMEILPSFCPIITGAECRLSLMPESI
jgi:hypothetical protein